MRRWVTALVMPFVVSLALVGCGKSANTETTSDTTSPGVSAASTCPSSPQRTLVKTRFAADIGLIIGTTKHFIYTPYTEGKFAKGAHGRILAIVKAGAAGAAVLHLTHNAIDNAKADPTLCKVLLQPLTHLASVLSGLKGKLLSGDLSGVGGVASTVDGLGSAASGQGLKVVSGLIPGL